MPLITKLRESIDSSDGSAFLKALKFLMRSSQDYASPESPATPISPESPAPFIRNLVLQGGGAKGAAYSGLIQALEEECILQHIETFVGSSAGAISAFILALGFNAKEFADIINQHNLQDLFDYIPTEDSTFAPVTAIAQCAITLTNGYVYSGDNALNFFEMLCQEILGNPRATFEDLEKQKASNPKLRSLIVTATKVNTLGGFEKKERYGSELFSFKHSKDVVIADAIRASMSIPVVYRNHTVKNSNDETVGTFADGGIYNNFAIQVLDEQEYMDPSYNMFGINHSTLGATLVSKLDPHITKVPVPKLLEHKKTKTSPVPVQTPPQSEASNANSIISAVLTGLKIKMKMDGITTSQPEDLADKTQQHRHRVIQIHNADVSPVDFATAKKALLHSHGYTATISTIHTHLDPRQHDRNQSRKLLGFEEVRDDKNTVLTRLLTEFIIEFNKYKDVPISPLYNKADITENVRLRYVAHQILHNVKPTEDELQISLSKVLTTLTNTSTVDSAIQARYQGVTDDTMITRKLFSLLTTVPYDDETFKRFLNGQFSRGMHFIQKKQTATEFNLLQTAVQIQNIQAVGTILRYIEITHKQLTQQTRSVKALQEVIHDCQPSLLNIARSNEQQEMVDLLQKLTLDTSLPTRVAFEPDQAIKEEAQRLYGALETSLPPTSEMKGQLITLFNHPDADASNLLHRAIHENNLDKVQAICKILDMSDSKYFQSTSKGYIDRKLNGKTALYLAAEMGHAGIVQYLRTKDALVEETGPSACPSAMIIAAKNKHFDVVNKLLESKGTFSSFTATITRKTIDQDGSTAIHYVAQSGSAQDIYNILFTSVNQATIKSPYGHRRDRQGFHALDCIVRREDAETILRELITICGFNTNDNKRRNFFCLTFDIYKSTGSEFLSTFEYALLYKYNIAEMINQCLPKSFERTELEQQRLDLVGYRLDIARKIETMSPSTLATHFQPLIAAHQDTIIEQEASPATSSYQQQALSFSLFSENESSQEAELQRLKSELTKITRIINQKISQVNEQAKKLNKRNDDSARNIYLCIGLSCLLLITAFLISSIFLLLAAISCILIIGALIQTPDTPHIKDLELGRKLCTP